MGFEPTTFCMASRRSVCEALRALGRQSRVQSGMLIRAAAQPAGASARTYEDLRSPDGRDGAVQAEAAESVDLRSADARDAQPGV
jgi:hypothetical protein